MKIDASWYIRPQDPIAVKKSAGGIVVRVLNGEILIALVTEPHINDYLLPKGGVESGEDLEFAARREIQEEAGITDLKKIDYLGVTEHYTLHKKRWQVIHFYLFLTTQIKTNATDTSHTYTTHWFSIDELPLLFWPDQKDLIETNRKKIKELLNV